MLIFVLFAWWFGQRTGTPILHMMDWLKSLGKGNYTEPVNRLGQPGSIGRDGKRKGNFAIYSDVMDSLATLTSTLKRDAIARKETEKARDEWIAGVSHDLKTPLSSIKGYAYMLENDDYEWSTEEVRSFAKVMLDKSNHMEGLISDLNLEYQLRSGITLPYTELVELNAYIPETLYGAGISQDNQAMRIVFVPTEQPVYLNVYKPWFQRIIDNLTVNAFLHNHGDTILTVTVFILESGKIGLSFSDNGNGMDEETQMRLFERYYRGTDTESATEGSGLGMAVAKALVEVHHGVIHVESKKGEGTNIRLLWQGQSTQ
ncbi:Signal-transduction histidine kinase senX3 [compost metagenome]